MNQDQKVLSEIQKMCEESLSPDIFEKWGEVRGNLCNNREQLKTHWEFKEWVEKATGEAWIIGVDTLGGEYEATGIMGGGEIVEITHIKKL